LRPLYKAFKEVLRKEGSRRLTESEDSEGPEREYEEEEKLAESGCAGWKKNQKKAGKSFEAKKIVHTFVAPKRTKGSQSEGEEEGRKGPEGNGCESGVPDGVKGKRKSSKNNEAQKSKVK